MITSEIQIAAAQSSRFIVPSFPQNSATIHSPGQLTHISSSHSHITSKCHLYISDIPSSLRLHEGIT